MIKNFKPKTKLESDVVEIIDSYDDRNSIEFLKEVTTHGCISGIISELIYYEDTINFYNEHKEEIKNLIKHDFTTYDMKSCVELFGDKWDYTDIDISSENNRNLLAWCAFEHTCYIILEHELE